MNFKKLLLFLVLALAQKSFSQEGVAVYSDYLSDNYYLLHPSMAGAANCAKLRLTARAQWFGQEDAPALQTLSFNGRVGDQSGIGAIVYNDRNGYHSQRGFKFTYAHHIRFSRDDIDLNQLSFGLSGGLTQSSLDETEFLRSGDFDPIVDGTIVQKDSYFNIDFGLSYNYLDFYIHATLKNAIETRREIYTQYESDNIRKAIINVGYIFGDEENWMWEPSAMLQYVDKTKEAAVDVNLKVYKTLEFGSIWGGLSYRRSFDGADYIDNNSVQTQKLSYFTPLVGVNYKSFMFAYTYTHLTGDVKFDNGGFHQITLGMNLWCHKERYHCKCPAIN